MRKQFLILLLVLCLIVEFPVKVFAVTKNEAQAEKKKAQESLNSINNNISAIQEDREEVEEEIIEIDAQLVDLLLTVDLISGDIDNKQVQIEDARVEYEDALAKEQNQYDSMKRRIKFMYEKGDIKYIEVFLQAQSFAEIINKADYVEKLYEYDRQMLVNYQKTKEEVGVLKANLENEKNELVEMQEEYVAESKALEELVNQKKNTLSDFDAQLSAAKAQASKYQAQIAKQTEVLKRIEAEEAAARKAAEEARKKAEAEAKKKAEAEAKKKEEEAKSKEEAQETQGTETIEDTTSAENTEVPEETKQEESVPEVKQEEKPVESSSGGGSAKGQEIANFACKYVGNPYVSGGTSLTNGADCSGFTYSVYKNFGYTIPRNSYAQSTYGKEVSYAQAQPGDIIYYGGHVGIYIGGGKIVHASTAATGIKISNALYRSIITVRRII